MTLASKVKPGMVAEEKGEEVATVFLSFVASFKVRSSFRLLIIVQPLPEGEKSSVDSNEFSEDGVRFEETFIILIAGDSTKQTVVKGSWTS